MKTGRLHWESDGLDWPHRAFSRFVVASRVRWHVQVMGAGPALLLLHGTGAASHSWRALAPALARHYTVVAPDLPGHAFSEPLPLGRLSLPGMAHALGELLATLRLAPVAAVGHSAGAAIAARMSLDGHMAPAALVSINGAFLPPAGWPGVVFLPAARLLALSPFVSRLVARQAADPSAVQRLIDSTGSRLDAEGAALYRKLVRSPQHVASTLAMMARWDLRPLLNDLVRLAPRLTLIVGEGDRTLDPRQAAQVARRVPAARIVRLPALGHLAHEEAPQIVLDHVLACCAAPSSATVPG
jgi:magnesium chelatase accessory protein